MQKCYKIIYNYRIIYFKKFEKILNFYFLFVGTQEIQKGYSIGAIFSMATG